MSHYDGDIKGKKVALWGISFKPETDDIREATSLVLMERIHEAGGIVKAYDPISMEESKKRVDGKAIYSKE